MQISLFSEGGTGTLGPSKDGQNQTLPPSVDTERRDGHPQTLGRRAPLNPPSSPRSGEEERAPDDPRKTGTCRPFLLSSLSKGQLMTDHFREDSRPLIALDWAQRAVHYTLDGVEVFEAPDLLSALEGQPPSKVALENTFESYDLRIRRAMTLEARALGHEVYGIRPKNTASYRRSLGVEKTSDEDDARYIFAMAMETSKHFSVFRLPLSDEETEHREGLASAYVKMRYRGEKPALVKRAKELVTPWKELPEEEQKIAGSAGYAPSLLAPVLYATEATSSRSEFEALLGLHGSGHPTIFRSEIYHHWMRHQRKKGATLSECRRFIRKLRGEMIQALRAATDEGESYEQE